MPSQELEQVLTTLVVIARDALPAGGAIGIETGLIEAFDASGTGVDIRPGPHALLKVTAVGCGVRPAAGTSALEETVRRNGGFLTVSPGGDSETSISICLPPAPGTDAEG
jgi:hypothetical protein